MSEPGTYNLVLYRGDSYAWDFRLWEDEAKTVPLDLTGCAVAAEIRNEPGGACVTAMALEVELPNIIHATLSGEACGAAQDGGWDLQVTGPDDDVNTLLRGSVRITDDYTESSR